HAEPDALEVDCDEAVEIFFGGFDRIRHAALNPRIVEGAVDTAIGLEGFVNHHLDLVGHRHVRGDAAWGPAGFLDHGPCALTAGGDLIDNHDFRAFLREPERSRTTDA